MAAKTFIDNLGVSIYKEYSSALSHDDIQLSFKEVIRKLPKGPLRKKLKTNFDKYSSRLEKHIAKLSGTHLPTPPPEIQDESLHELSVIEHRHEVGESSRLDNALIFNMLKQAPDLPNEGMLRGYTKDQKRQIYSLYLQQGLVRRDVGIEKLKQVIDRLEKCLSKKSTTEDSSNFKWAGLMDYIIQLSAGLNPIAVIRILRILFERVQSDIDKCLLSGKPVRSGKIAKILEKYLLVLHMRVQESKLQGTDSRPFCRYMSSLLSYYIDLTCVHSSKVAKKHKLGRQLCGFVSYLLSSWPEQILEAVLNSCMLVEEEKERAKVLVPLIRKCVSLKPETGNHDMYMKYVLVVRKARDTLEGLEEVTIWTMTTRQLPAGKGFIDWLHDQCSEAVEQMPTEDKKFKKSHITKFLLEEADEDLIELLTNSLKSMVGKVTDENFLSAYNDTEYDDEVVKEMEGESGVGSATEQDTLFFLDTAGTSKGAKKPQGKKSPVLLKTMDDLESIVDKTTDEQSEARESQAYKLDSVLLDKFIDPADKEFVKSDIVSIKKLTCTVGDSDRDDKDTFAKSGKESAKTSKKKETREAVLTPSRSGKGKVKELHTRKKANVQQVFVSETESETSFSKTDCKDNKQLKSVVCKMMPVLEPIDPEGKFVSVSSNEPGSAILISDIDKSETDMSEVRTDPFTMSLAGSESEGCPPNSIVEESEINSSIEVPAQYSLLSQLSEDKLPCRDVEPADIMLIDSEMDETDTESSRVSSIVSQVTDTTLSTISQTEPLIHTSRSGLETTEDLQDSADETLQITVQEYDIPKSTSEELQFAMDMSHASNRHISQSSKMSPKKRRKSSSEKTQLKGGEEITKPKHSQRSPRKSKTSGSETANSSVEKDETIPAGDSVQKKAVTEVKDESAVFIELSNDDDESEEDRHKPEKSPLKSVQNSDTVAIKSTKTAAEKFIEKAVKSKTPKKSESKDKVKTNSFATETAGSRTKSTEDIVTIVEEIQHKLSTSLRRASRRSEIKDTSMFTDSTASNDSDTPETLEDSKPNRSSKKSSKSDEADMVALGQKRVVRLSPRKKSSQSSESDQNVDDDKAVSPKLNGSAKKVQNKKERKLSNESYNVITIIENEDLIEKDGQKGKDYEATSPIKKLKSPKTPKEKFPSDTKPIPVVKTPESDKKHKNHSTVKTPQSEEKASSPSKNLKSPKTAKEEKKISSDTELTPNVKSPELDKKQKIPIPNKTPPSEEKASSPTKNLKSPKTPKEEKKIPSDTELTRLVKSPELDKTHKKQTPNKTPKSPVNPSNPSENLKSPKTPKEKKIPSDTELTLAVKSPELDNKHKKQTPNKTPKSEEKKGRKRSNELYSPIALPSESESVTQGKKKQRLSSSEEEAKESPSGNKSLNSQVHRRSVTKLKTPVSAEKRKKLKSYSLNQSLSDIKAKTQESDLEDFVVPSSQSKSSSRKSSHSKSDLKDKEILMQDSDAEKDTPPPSKKKILVSESDDDDELPDLGKFLKKSEKDEGSFSPQISKKHNDRKTPEKKGKEEIADKDKKSEKEKVSPTKSSPVATRRTLRVRQGPESQEPSSDKAVQMKSATKPETQSKRTSVAGGRRKSILPTKVENESEKEQSETEAKPKRSVAGKNVAIKEPEKEAPGQKTPQSKPALRKLSASTSKKAAPKMEETRLGRKRRLSGEMSASDRGSIGGESTDSEISFPKVKKGTTVETKATSRVSKRLSTSTVPAEQATTQSRRYSLRKK